jgi:trk system potassium uptake protein
LPVTIQSRSSEDKLVFRLPQIPALRLPFVIPRPTTPLSSTILLAYGFFGLMILGAGLLMLPWSSASGQFTSPIDAFFTATSAVCVTGLVVVDTGTYWSAFGQGVLFALFQIGGFGFITGATLLLFAINRRFGLRERLLITESLGLDRLGGLMGVVVRLAVFSLGIEALGTLVLYTRWEATADPGSSLWRAIFVSASAFNNCGMGLFGNFRSLTGYQGDAIILLTSAFLIILGSTGYIVIADYIRSRRFSKLSLESKLVSFITLCLLLFGALFYFVMELSNQATLGSIPFPQNLIVAFFQSATARTAGFTAVDIGSLKQVTLFFTMLLMFVGGTAGSTAGGVKVNTIGVLALTVISMIKGKRNVNAFDRQLTRDTIYRAIVIFFAFLGTVCVFALALSITEAFSFDKILFESFSALGTVGLSTGITPYLSWTGRFIVIIAMFLGKLGPLALMAFLVHHRQPVDIDYPRETIRLG